ncbi:MAG: tetraacyldisaccharide 4'-kinase [Dokdonella sp.]
MSARGARLQSIWYRPAPPPWSLRALVPVYRALRAIDLAPYRFGWREPEVLPVPVIVVGNISVGGTGKTPLVIALVEALRARGFSPGVVSRGYGGSARVPQLLGDNADPNVVGDEPCLIQRRTRAPVAIGRDRPSAARLLLREKVDVVIADDGLQNPSLARAIEICVIDGERRFGNGFLLPAGPLREPVERLETVNFRVCNGGNPATDEVPMQLCGGMAVAVNDATITRPLRDFADTSVHAIAGIGNPERFFATLRAHRIDVIAHLFPDHYAYRPDDLEFVDELPVLMTEKDAIKCAPFAPGHCWQGPVRAEVPAAFFERLIERLRHG